uniref:Uncharacterized protein n=1 Tax=Chromera velia CCMP2878 TaxID=1169474 RepID=A0A0G4HJD8_9ALVE|eukprot:Cvel_28097.t1-p1 / transcript=Cvel_28097.t1 / gene=Cvel_28097 / organism=Chromera_velia_CCMP2878 / gene_product=hypothetical protein / transcript_product=hypothetical protein / location=Cvel_scaffold3617:8747-8983(-) / protein_length=79 / sequence_SO=supercontig / SO=protein_coding / is_pseudo=false
MSVDSRFPSVVEIRSSFCATVESRLQRYGHGQAKTVSRGIQRPLASQAARSPLFEIIVVDWELGVAFLIGEVDRRPLHA